MKNHATRVKMDAPTADEETSALLPPTRPAFGRANSVTSLGGYAELLGDAADRPASLARRGTMAIGMSRADLIKLHGLARRSRNARALARNESIAHSLLDGWDDGDAVRLARHLGEPDDDDDDDDDDVEKDALGAVAELAAEEEEEQGDALPDTLASFRRRRSGPSLQAAQGRWLPPPQPGLSSAVAAARLSPARRASAAAVAGLAADASSEEPGSWLDSCSVRTLSLLLVLCGCACAAPCDVLHGRDRGCSDLISICEYLFGLCVSAPGALREWRARGRLRFPLRWHVGLALAGVGYTFCLNGAASALARGRLRPRTRVAAALVTVTRHAPRPHARAAASPGVAGALSLRDGLPLVAMSTLKNGNLAANVAVGSLALGRRYSGEQLGAVAVVTAGLVLTALGAAQRPAAAATTRASGLGAEGLGAIALLCGALLLRASAGAAQEAAYARFGRASVSEVLFVRNALGLPLLLTRLRPVARHAALWARAPDVGGLRWPCAWLLLLANLLTDYGCKALMTKLIGASSALTATLCLTFQKFCAFAIGALLLAPADDPSRRSLAIWAGRCAVLIGTTAYSTLAQPPAPALPMPMTAAAAMEGRDGVGTGRRDRGFAGVSALRSKAE
jgi:hypothetical protein